jgi:putative ABC transport system ATP-binding protein
VEYVETHDVCKVYRARSRSEVRAIDGVSLSIPRGSFAVLTGPSGSGKTTLLAMLGALERLTQGQILFDGRDLSGASDSTLARLRRRAGFIFQDFALLPNLFVWENITYPLIPRGVSRRSRHETARNLLMRLGIPDKLMARPSELSGGEQQRVAVARALAGEPEILFADEPTSNLDTAASQDLITILQEFHSHGGTVVVSSHDSNLVALATQIHELRGGRLILPA